MERYSCADKAISPQLNPSHPAGTKTVKTRTRTAAFAQ